MGIAGNICLVPSLTVTARTLFQDHTLDAEHLGRELTRSQHLLLGARYIAARELAEWITRS